MGVQEWQIQHIASLRFHQSFRDQTSQNLRQPHSMNLIIYQWILTLGRVPMENVLARECKCDELYKPSQRRGYYGVSGAINSGDSRVIVPNGRIWR